MDPILVMYGSAASRVAARRRLDRDLERRRVIRERAASASAQPRSVHPPRRWLGILSRLRPRPS